MFLPSKNSIRSFLLIKYDWICTFIYMSVRLFSFKYILNLNSIHTCVQPYLPYLQLCFCQRISHKALFENWTSQHGIKVSFQPPFLQKCNKIFSVQLVYGKIYKDQPMVIYSLSCNKLQWFRGKKDQFEIIWKFSFRNLNSP